MCGLATPMIILICLAVYTVLCMCYVMTHLDGIEDVGWLAMMGDYHSARWVWASNLLLLPCFWSAPYYWYHYGTEKLGLMHAAFKFRWNLNWFGEIVFTVTGLLTHAFVVWAIWRTW